MSAERDQHSSALLSDYARDNEALRRNEHELASISMPACCEWAMWSSLRGLSRGAGHSAEAGIPDGVHSSEVLAIRRGGAVILATTCCKPHNLYPRVT